MLRKISFNSIFCIGKQTKIFQSELEKISNPSSVAVPAGTATLEYFLANCSITFFLINFRYDIIKEFIENDTE